MSIPDVQLSSLYQQLILEHYKKPRNRGTLEDGTVEVHMRNPACGDEIKLQFQNELDPCVIKPGDDTDFLAVVMPMRI